MSTFYSGQAGQLYINGTKAAKVSQWSFNAAQSTLDTTSLEDTDRTSIAGIRSVSGTCSLFYYEQTDGANSCSELIDYLIKPATDHAASPGIAPLPQKVTLRLQAGASRYLQGDVWITSAAMTMAVGAVLSAQVSFEFDGAPSLDTL